MKHSMLVALSLVAVMLVVSSPALATSVTLVPSMHDVTPGSTVDIAVYMDVSSPGITMTAISTDIVYDTNVFTYDEPSGVTQGALLTHNWDLLGAQTATLRVGGIDWDFGEYLAEGAGTLFTFTLKVSNDALTGSYELAWGDAGNGVGFDYGDENYNDVIPPSFGASINVVPEPGTLVLLVTAGLGLLAYAWRRRRS